MLALLWMGGIFYFSAQTGDTIGLKPPLDKLAHFFVYSVLGFLLARATGSWRAGLVLTAFYGAFDEVHQAFVPGREAGLADWWFDLLGGFVGARLGGWRRRPKESVPPQVELSFER